MADGFTLLPDWGPELDEFIRTVDARARQAIAEVGYDHMLDVMDVARERAPYDTGALAGSGTVERPVVSERGIFIDMHFGRNPALSYALRQHEDLTLFHPNGKVAKFLESAITDWFNDDGPSKLIDDVSDFIS